MDRIDFLKRRKNYVCASDVAAIAGFNPYKTAVDVYLDKINPDVIDDEMSEAAYFGTLLEEVIANEYARRTGFDLEVETELLTHPDYPFLAANIDRWVDNKQHVLEIKTAGFMQRDKWGIEGTDSIPDHYLLQCAMYASICNVPFVDICLLLGGQELKIYKYHRDIGLEGRLIKICKNFWENHVLKQVPPSPMNYTDMNKIYPHALNTAINADNNIMMRYQDLMALKAQAAEIEKEIQKQQFAIQEYMKENSILLDNNGKVLATWKPVKGRTLLDSKALQKDLPDIYKQYSSQGNGYRAFSIKERREGIYEQ